MSKTKTQTPQPLTLNLHHLSSLSPPRCPVLPNQSEEYGPPCLLPPPGTAPLHRETWLAHQLPSLPFPVCVPVPVPIVRIVTYTS